MKKRLLAVWKRAGDASPIRKVGASLLAVAFVIALVGYLNQHGNLYLGLTLYNLLGDFYANTSAELASIAITVLIIDTLYQRREINREKRDLILQLGSPDNAFAREALRKLRARKWLIDGSLSGANLRRANLEGAFLIFANLEGAFLGGANQRNANLISANLEGASLSFANLRGANLGSANLRGADLWSAKLEGTFLGDADLWSANLRDAKLMNTKITDTQLARTKSLEGATMPDGAVYDGRFDKEDQS